MDRNFCAKAARGRSRVALLAEGVDRNTYEGQTFDELNLSPSSRRAWIEIVQRTDPSDGEIVALLAEGVDRNLSATYTDKEADGSPSSRRAWIEIRCPRGRNRPCRVALLAEGVDRNMMPCALFILVARRPPRGGRG